MEPSTPPVPVAPARRGPSLPLVALLAVGALVVLWPRLAPAPPRVPDEQPIAVVPAGRPVPPEQASVARPRVPGGRSGAIDRAVAAARAPAGVPEPAPGVALEPAQDARRAGPRTRGRGTRDRTRARRRPSRRPPRAVTPAVTPVPPPAAPPAYAPPRRRSDVTLLP